MVISVIFSVKYSSNVSIDSGRLNVGCLVMVNVVCSVVVLMLSVL